MTKTDLDGSEREWRKEYRSNFQGTRAVLVVGGEETGPWTLPEWLIDRLIEDHNLAAIADALIEINERWNNTDWCDEAEYRAEYTAIQARYDAIKGGAQQEEASR